MPRLSNTDLAVWHFIASIITQRSDGSTNVVGLDSASAGSSLTSALGTGVSAAVKAVRAAAPVS